MTVCDIWMECKREQGADMCKGIGCNLRNDLMNMFDPKDDAPRRDTRGWYKEPQGITTQKTSSLATRFVCTSCGKEVQVKVPRLYTMAKEGGFREMIRMKCVCRSKMSTYSEAYEKCASCGFRRSHDDGILCWHGGEIKLDGECKFRESRYRYGGCDEFPRHGEVVIVDE
jgi:hypothetical protein